MLTRRDVLVRAAVAGAAALVRPAHRAFPKAAQPSTPVDFEVPVGACDCHTHIFGDSERFPFSPTRSYTPEEASIAEMRSLHRALHTDRVVIAQPTVYGTNNDCTIDAVKQLGPGARAVAMVDEKISEVALDEMQRAGVRGLRINLETVGQIDPALAQHRLPAAITKIGKRNWHIEIYTRLSVIEAIAGQVKASTVPVSFDHFGGAQAALGVDQPGFKTLLQLLQTGKAYVKLSAPYRSSTHPPDYADVAPLAKALIAANPQRILWGTDWPHPAQVPGRKPTEMTALYQIDDGRVFNQFPIWASSAALRKTILVDNPVKLYGF